MNKAILIGNIGRAPEFSTPSGHPVARFSLATNRQYKDKDGKLVKITDWHRIVTWGRLAEIIRDYARKGRLISIEGRIETRPYEDREKVKRTSTEIVALSVEFLGGRKEEEAGANEAASGARKNEDEEAPIELASLSPEEKELASAAA